MTAGSQKVGGHRPPLQQSPSFLDRLRQRFEARHVIPAADEPPLSIENENGKLRRKRIDPELHNCFPVKISDHENVVARIPVDVAVRIHFLDVLRFDIEPMPNHRGNQSAQRRQDVLLKIHQSNQAEFRITQRNLGDTISNGLRLRFIAGVDDRKNCYVPIRGGNLMPVDIGKRERVSCPGMQLNRLRGRRRQEQNEEKILRAAEHRA